MSRWTVRIEKPGGDGGWEPVDVVFPRGGSETISAEDAMDAAGRVLDHYWPVNLHAAMVEGEDWSVRVRRRAAAQAGTAGHRMILEPHYYSWDPPDKRETLTVLVGDVLLHQIRQNVTDKVKHNDRVKELRKQLEDAKIQVRLAGYGIESASEAATRAGVDPKAIAKASRAPRRPTSGSRP